MLSIVLNKLRNVSLAYRIYNKLYLCYKICRWNVVDCSEQTQECFCKPIVFTINYIYVIRSVVGMLSIVLNKLRNVSLAYRIYNKLYLCYKICRWNVVDCSEQTQECFSSLSYLQ